MKKKLDPKSFAPAAPAAPAAPPDAGYSRLHITPLDPQLLKVVVPSAVLPRARNISFHSLQTFPDRPYGFVDLPTADADKIKKKLNGAVLKGSKIRIEPARPVNVPKTFPDAIMDPRDGGKSKKSKSEKREKKRKRDNQEVVGVELEEGRKVKRGWTVTPEEAAAKKKKEEEDRKLAKSKKKEEKKKKKQKKDPESKYSEGPECLVKTTLPPNKLDMADDITGGHKKKAKKEKKRDVVVHEFEKNTKFATFLKATQPANTAPGHTGATFVKGKGWVNEDGSVVEEVKSTRPTAIPKLQVKTEQATSESAADDDTSSSSGGSSSEDESELPSRSVEQRSIDPQPTSPAEDNTTTTDSANEIDSARPKSASSIRSLTIRIPPATPTPASTSNKIHPLEALYKRQKQEVVTPNKPSADSEPFTFFGGRDIDEDEDMADGQSGEGSGLEGEDGGGDHPTPSQGPQPPMTPFTKQDFEWRNVRSAAPTPDTAHPSRMSRIWYQRGDEDEGLGDVEEDQGEDDDGHSMAGEGRAPGGEDDVEGPTNPNTDFQKWFWEHRGDLNRSWKKRRKTTAKEKRYRENRARADRAI